MKPKRKISLLTEIAILFILAIIVTGGLTYINQRTIATEDVMTSIETRAKMNAADVMVSIREYPAYQWLIRYWRDHVDTMDIEYDADFYYGEKTKEKARLLAEHHPELQLKYATEDEITAMSEEDQKLYAEVVYSWMITRLDQIKRAHKISFLFCVIASEDYKEQFFLLSAADAGQMRGTDYEQVYPLGTTVTVLEQSQSDAMRTARKNTEHLASAGKYVDYYSHLVDVDGQPVLIGLTFNMTEMNKAIDQATIVGMIQAMIFELILALICMAIIYFFAIRPTKKVQTSIRNYKETKDSAMARESLSQIRSRNEIGELATDVSDLSLAVDNYVAHIQEITADKERIETELALGTRIQEGMLPSSFPAFPDNDEFDIHASMDPAKEVGGDFYDFFLIDETHLCMVMADVSGKGVPAALFMMAAKIILANNARMGKSPAQILEDTNTAICASNQEEMFVTVWLGILDLKTGSLVASNAGHEYPAIMHKGGGFELFKDKHGFVIGGMDGVKYSEYELTLEPGSKLFLYTDGVPEATDAENNLFGTDRMIATLNEVIDESPEQILGGVRRSVDAFVKEAEQFDDLTMMCVEYKG